MSADLFRQAEALFLELSELDREQWEPLLRERCRGNEELLREVSSLLKCHAQANTIVDAAELNRLRAMDADAPPDDEELPPGSRIDEFVIKRVLGKGGMGNVYIAEQDKPRRTVALKVIRRGLATSAVMRRFEHEAEFLGRLHHPGIAQIFAAGTAVAPSTGGRHPASQPFIAMELVNGPPLNEYVAQRGLSRQRCMAIVADVCDAVQHAHQRGVIHRDLKPANILVDEHGRPKVLDFGVARAADGDVGAATMQTRAGQIIGTLPYMSPEQILGDAAEIDTRSDVYALGVMLYQLLAGKLPLDVTRSSIAEAARVIRDEAPPKLGRIDRSMRGDVETIAARALEKDKARRYQSAADLADDLRRFIAGRPIHARQDSALYVIRKQINRHKAVVAACVALLLAIVTFAVYASYQADKFEDLAVGEQIAKRKAEAALGEANVQRERADAVALRLKDELSASNVERGRLMARWGNLAGAEDLLWPEHLLNLNSHRTFFALWELYARQRCEATLPVNTPRALKMCLSPDGRVLATSGRSPGVLVHDTATFERLSSFGTPGVDHTAMCFLPGGELVTGDAAGRIAVWDPASGTRRDVIEDAGPGVTSLAANRTGTLVAAALADLSVKLFRVEGVTGTERVVAARPRVPARNVAFSPVTDELLVGCADGALRLVSPADLATIREFKNPDDNVAHVAFSPDGSLVAAGGAARLARVWRTSTAELVATLNAPNGSLQSVAFTPDGARLLTVGWWHLHVWDLGTQSLVDTFTGFRVAGLDICVSPDGKHAWLNLGATIRLWDLDPGAGRDRFDASTSRTLAVFSPTGELVAGEADGSVTLLSDPKGELIATLSKGARRVRAITISPAAPIAASVTVDGELTLNDLAQRKTIARWTGYKMISNDGMRFDSKGERLVLPAGDDTFKVIRIPTGETLITIPKDGSEALCACFSPDDRLIATTTRRGFLCLYNADSGEKVLECDGAISTPWTIVFSPDGSKVLSGTWSRTIDIWDVATGRRIRSLDGHRGLVTDLAFRPKEPTILASSGADGQVMLWDLTVPSDAPVLTLDAPDGWEVWALDFDRSGRRLMATNNVGATVIWDLRHFNRHIGGNMLARIAQHRAELGPAFDEKAAMAQQRLLLSRGLRAPGANR